MLTALAACGVAGCAEPAQRQAPLFPAAEQGQHDQRPFLIQPFADVKTDDAIVRVVSDVTCTGTIIAEDLVLTAHHCVAARDRRGRVLDHDKSPSELTVEIGDDDLPWAEVGVRAIVSPDCGYVSGAGDLAILVLQRKMIGMVMYPARTEGPPQLGEVLRPVGFGNCRSSPMGQRVLVDCDPTKNESCERSMRGEWASDPVQQIAKGYFVSQASICPGDSGGPVLTSRTDRGGVVTEVVGIISASAMDNDARTLGTTVFTRVDRWHALFSAAREIANGQDPSEVTPFRSCE